MSTLHISISAEKVAQLGPLVVSNSMLTSIVVSCLLLLLGLLIRSSLKSSGKPSRLQTIGELIIENFRNLIESVTGSGKKTELFLPMLITFFLFILVNNWFGLLPGVGSVGFYEQPKQRLTIQPDGAPSIAEKPVFIPYLRAGTADLNMTIALALITVGITQAWGFKYLKFRYLSRYFNISNPMNFILGILELVLEFAKIMSYAFRLFGNVFAGEVLLVVMTFLVPVVVPMPFYGLELFVGLIQALVFMMLSLVFFNMATVGHHEE